MQLFLGHPDIEKILARLRLGKPLLVTVSGTPGTDKSAFVCETLELAEERQGLRVIGKTDGELQVDSSSTKEWFCAQLRSRLGGESPEAPSYSNAIGSIDETQALVEQLKASSPVLIGISRFWPTEEFLHWFVGEFISRVKSTGAAIAILCADSHTGQLSSVADHEVNLDHLDEGWARQRLAAAGATLKPPLESQELEKYAEQLSARPELLASFLSVFRLAEAGT